MAYTFTVSDDFKVIVKEGNKKIDEVGAFDSFASAEYWANEMSGKFVNSELKYPGE